MAERERKKMKKVKTITSLTGSQIKKIIAQDLVNAQEIKNTFSSNNATKVRERLEYQVKIAQCLNSKKYYDILLNKDDKKLGTTFNSGALVEIVVKSLYGSDDRAITSKGKIDLQEKNIEIKATLTANTPARVQGLINSQGLDDVIIKFVTYKGCYTFTVKELKKAYNHKCKCFKDEANGIIKLKAINLPTYFKVDKELNEKLGY